MSLSSIPPNSFDFKIKQIKLNPRNAVHWIFFRESHSLKFLKVHQQARYHYHYNFMDNDQQTIPYNEFPSNFSYTLTTAFPTLQFCTRKQKSVQRNVQHRKNLHISHSHITASQIRKLITLIYATIVHCAELWYCWYSCGYLYVYAHFNAFCSKTFYFVANFLWSFFDSFNFI